MFNDPKMNMVFVVLGVGVLYLILIGCSKISKKTKKTVGVKNKKGSDTPDREMKSKKDVQFYFSPSCPHCKTQKNIIEQDSSLKESLEFINCQEYPDKCKGVSGVPMFEKGDKKLVGVQKADALQQLIRS